MSFSGDVGNFIKNAKLNQDKFVRQFSQELMYEVVQNTPVLTGFLRSSWHPYINNSGNDSSSGTADPSGQIALDRIALIVSNLKAGDVLYYINHAEYGVFVEYGTSRMEPRAFVRSVVARADTIAQRVATQIMAGKI